MAKVITATPYGASDNAERYEVEWPDDWPIPNIGDVVMAKDKTAMVVKHIVWYPYGEDGPEPFIYLVFWTQDMVSRNPFS
jgi:hypothetical protein